MPNNNQAHPGHPFLLRELLSGAYIADYDPDAHTPGIPYPTGFVHLTDDRNDALHFATEEDATAFVYQTSRVTPKGPDGKPNRPLLRFSLVLEPVSSHRGGPK